MRSVYAITLFVVSLVFALGINYWAGKRDLEYDEVSYQSLAEKYAETGVYGIDGIQAYRAPIYPMTLGVLYRCFGKDVVVGRIYQSVLSALMVALTYLLGDFLYSRKTGILAAGLLMLDSFWWLNQTVLTQENLVSVMTMISILLVLFSMQAQSVKKQISLMAVAGFTFGVALLTKPFLVPLVALVWLLLPFVQATLRKKALLLIAVFWICLCFPIAPWAYRNYHVFHHFVPFTTGSGDVFAGAHNHETFTTLKGNWIAVLPTEDDLHSLTGLSPSAKEYSLDKLMTKKGWEEIHQHSVSKLATLVVYKWARFFSPSTFFETPTVFHKGIKVVLLGFNALVLLAFVFSLVEKSTPHRWLPLLVGAASLAVVTIFYGTIRFRYPLSPLIAVYAALFIRNCFQGDVSPIFRNLIPLHRKTNV